MIEELRHKMITEAVMLVNTFEQIAIRRNKGAYGRFHAKFKGGNEYPIKRTSQVVVEALFEGSEITELQYLNY